MALNYKQENRSKINILLQVPLILAMQTLLCVWNWQSGSVYLMIEFSNEHLTG